MLLTYRTDLYPEPSPGGGQGPTRQGHTLSYALQQHQVCVSELLLFAAYAAKVRPSGHTCQGFLQASRPQHRLFATSEHLSAAGDQDSQVIRPRRPTISLPEPSPEPQQQTTSTPSQTRAEALYRQRALTAQRDRRRPSVIRAAPPSFSTTPQGQPAADQPVVRSKPAARRRRAVRQAAFQPVPTPVEELQSKQLLQQPEHVPGMGSFARKLAQSNVSRENWRDAVSLHPASVAASSSGMDEQRAEATRRWHEWKAAVAKDQERFDRPEEAAPEVHILA